MKKFVVIAVIVLVMCLFLMNACVGRGSQRIEYTFVTCNGDKCDKSVGILNIKELIPDIYWHVSPGVEDFSGNHPMHTYYYGYTNPSNAVKLVRIYLRPRDTRPEGFCGQLFDVSKIGLLDSPVYSSSWQWWKDPVPVGVWQSLRYDVPGLSICFNYSVDPGDFDVSGMEKFAIVIDCDGAPGMLNFDGPIDHVDGYIIESVQSEFPKVVDQQDVNAWEWRTVTYMEKVPFWEAISK